MRTLTIAMLLVLLAARAVEGQLTSAEALKLFTEANEAYLSAEKLNEEGDQHAASLKYEAARVNYERLAAGGYARACVYYNLGNTYAKLNSWGGAIWSYRRALRLAPRDADTIANLSYARDRSLDAIPRRESAFIRSLLFWHFGLSLGETQVVALFAYYSASIALCLWFFFRRHSLRKFTYVLIVLLIAFTSSVAVKLVDQKHPGETVIVAESVDVLSGPSKSSEVRLRLHSGAEVKLEETDDGWFKIYIDKKRRGWVPGSACRVI